MSLARLGGLLVVVAVLFPACQKKTMQQSPEVATPAAAALSPSGELSLIVKEVKDGDIPLQYFEVYPAGADEPVFVSAERYDVRHTTWFLWGAEDRVWVYSGDVGTYFWERAGEEWQKRKWYDSGVEAPPYLKAQRPKIFDR